MKSKFKICYVSPNAHLGGAERIIEELIENRDQSRFDVAVVFFKQGPLVEKWRALGAKVFVTSPFRLRNIFSLSKACGELRAFAETEKFDLVHSHLSFGHFVSAIALRGLNIPLMWFQHGPVGKGLDQLVNFSPARKVFFNSHFTQSQQKLSASTQQEVVFGPVDKPKNSDRSLRSQLGFSDADLVLINVARIDRWKGQSFLLKAFAQAYMKNPTLKLVFFGDTSIGSEEYFAELKKEVSELKLDQVVRFAGFQSNLEKIYSTGDIFIHSSLIPEPLGLSILEAQIRNLPVIAVNAGGPKEIIEDGVSGLLYESGNISDLSAKILSLSNSPERRKQLGASAAISAQRFESSKWTKIIEKSYLSED